MNVLDMCANVCSTGWSRHKAAVRPKFTCGLEKTPCCQRASNAASAC